MIGLVVPGIDPALSANAVSMAVFGAQVGLAILMVVGLTVYGVLSALRFIEAA